MAGGACMVGAMCGGACMAGGECMARGFGVRGRRRPLCGRYASYWNALLAAASEGHTDIVRTLLDPLKLRVLLSGNTPLLAAASEGHTDIVRILLDAGSNPLTVNNSGSTGLHMAAYQRNPSLLKVRHSPSSGSQEFFN